MLLPAIQARDLGRRYGRRWALARFSLEIPEGEILMVMGANGSGKTTLIRLVSTLLSRSMGELRIFGMDPAVDAAKIRPRLALLSHKTQLYDDLSSAENLEILAGLLGVEPRVDEWLEAVGLERRPDPVRFYSAGMRKRLAFARLLAQGPDLALIDEPYGQLDPEGFALFDRLVERLRARNVTAIIASHHVERAAQICDRGLLLQKGQIRWIGPAVDGPRAWAAQGLA